VIGIELITIDARIVIASVDTYLRFAEAVNRLDLTETQTAGLPELIGEVEEIGAEKKVSGAIQGAKQEVTPSSPALRTAAKGAAAAAAIGAAAAAAREIAQRVGSNSSNGEGED